MRANFSLIYYKSVLSICPLFAHCRDKDGDTPLHLASNGGHRHICELVLSQKGTEHLKSTANALGQTPADLAQVGNATSV